MTYAKRLQALMLGLATAGSALAQAPVSPGLPVRYELNLQPPVTKIASEIYDLHTFMRSGVDRGQYFDHRGVAAHAAGAVLLVRRRH